MSLLLSAPRNLVLLLLSTALWAGLFRAASVLSQRYVRVYRDFSRAEQGDWASRINSTIHAVVIVIGMLTTALKQEWDNDLLPLRSTSAATALFSLSCGYFLFDLYVLVRWKVPLWRVFVIHHIVAAVPYLIYNFHAGCGMDFYLLSLFLLVEFAVIPLNITTFLEQLGYGKTPVHKAFFYLTYVCWFGARVVLPLYNVYVLWERIIPNASESPLCVLPAAVCGHLIAAFCVGVFVFVWTPDVLAKWRAPVLQLDEYSDYELTLRQSITPRASPLTTPSTHAKKSAGLYNGNHRPVDSLLGPRAPDADAHSTSDEHEAAGDAVAAHSLAQQRRVPDEHEEHVEVAHDERDARALLLEALGQEHGADAGDRGAGHHSQQHINLRVELERLWSGWSNIGTGAFRRLGAFRVLVVAKEERGASDEEHANVRKQRARKVDPVNRLAQQQGALEINEDTATRRIRKDERDDRTREDDHDRVGEHHLRDGVEDERDTDRVDDAAEGEQVAKRRLDAQVDFIDADSDLAIPKIVRKKC